MTRINALRNIAGTRDSVAWGKETNNIANNLWGNIDALVFAAVLIACSLTVGCSSDKPRPVSSNNQIPVTQPQSPIMPTAAPVTQAENKPAPKKVVHRKPAAVNYADKTYGVTFEYPRRYAIETGDAAADLLSSSPMPMNFIAPGGVALAAVELPETSFANTDFSSAFFNVSIHKNLTADQCNEFAVPMPKEVSTAAAVEPATTAKPETAPVATTATNPSTEAASPSPAPTPAPSNEPSPATPGATAAVNADATASQPAQTASQTAVNIEQAKSEPASTDKASSELSSAQPASGAKLLVGDMELHATEAVSGEGTRQSDSKYFHVFQNGSCYEFALNVTTVASSDGLIKHVDRDKVFSRLEKILDTVKINPIVPETTAEAPATPTATATPAQ
jgi:hypothetical protein